MKRTTRTREIKKLKIYSARLNEILANKQAHTSFEIGQLYVKVKTILASLKNMVAHSQLRKALGAAAIIFGLSLATKANAQDFLAPKANPFGLDTSNIMSAPAFVDLDGDGDLDVMIGTWKGQWNYFENVGTAKNPSFKTPLLNPFNLDTTGILSLPNFADFDDDGDYDLMVGNSYNVMDSSGYGSSGRILYYENIGTSKNANFALPIANPFGADTSLYFSFSTVADLDNDGDYDILVGEYFGNMEYLENIGTKTSPKFASPVDLPFGMNHVYQAAVPCLADFDGDGDYDLLVGNMDGLFTYFKNIGSKSSPKFDVGQNDPFGMNDTTNDSYIKFVAAADLDDDGDIDVLIGSIDDILRYYEQETITGIKEPKQKSITVFPNPTNDQISLSKNQYDRIEIIDIFGKIVLVETANIRQLSLKDLSVGTYTIRFSNAQGQIEVQLITKI